MQTLLSLDVCRLAPPPTSSHHHPSSSASAAPPLETVADRAEDWLHSQAHSVPGLRGLALANLHRDAEALVARAWRPAAEASAARAAEELRASPWFLWGRLTSAAGSLARALLRHRLLALLLGPARGPLRRYQRALSLFTGFLAILATDVFAHWRRAQACCAELRQLLSCPADPSAPCREFSGDCADLRAVFGGFPDAPGVAGWACSAYPSPSKWHERLQVCAVMMAISFGAKLAIERVFELANAAPEPGVRLHPHPPRHPPARSPPDSSLSHVNSVPA